MEIKFHIIVKLKGDLTDLLKQVHIYHAGVRMKSLWSLKHKEILSFGCGETHWEFAWETVVKEFKRQLHIAGCGKSLITILGREEKNEKKRGNEQRRNWRIAGYNFSYTATLCLSKSASGERGSAQCDLEKMRKIVIWGKLSEQQQMSCEVHFLCSNLSFYCSWWKNWMLVQILCSPEKKEFGLDFLSLKLLAKNCLCLLPYYHAKPQLYLLV